MIVDQIKPVLTHHQKGDMTAATNAYGRVAMAINHEIGNVVGGLARLPWLKVVLSRQTFVVIQ